MAVALSEAVTNAIDHGNLELDSELRQDDERVYHRLGEERGKQSPYCERRVQVSVGVTRSEATFTIRDQGPGFDVTKLPDPTDPTNLCRIGGRGLLLIRTLMDEVRFNSLGNEITLLKRKQA
jgi:anti-sigma regulatory factor (Ser/Thr protein kinase)